MLKFKRRDRLYPMPRSWKAPNGRQFSWDSGKEQFEAYYARIAAYAGNNNFTPPTAEEIEDHLCRQSSGRECTSSEDYHAPARALRPLMVRSKGCSSCGKRA